MIRRWLGELTLFVTCLEKTSHTNGDDDDDKDDDDIGENNEEMNLAKTDIEQICFCFFSIA